MELKKKIVMIEWKDVVSTRIRGKVNAKDVKLCLCRSFGEVIDEDSEKIILAHRVIDYQDAGMKTYGKDRKVQTSDCDIFILPKVLIEKVTILAEKQVLMW